jgi:hypothetical protein
LNARDQLLLSDVDALDADNGRGKTPVIVEIIAACISDRENYFHLEQSSIRAT